MYINSIHGILGTTFAPIKRNNLVSFKMSQDTFVRSKEAELSLEQSIENSYSNIEKQLGIINGKDVALMVERIKQKFPNFSKEDIYYTMGVLSQYSSYKSWVHIEKEFEKENIDGIAVNPRSILDKKAENIGVCLTDVMNYLAEKNLTKLLPKKIRCNEDIILDDKIIEQIENEPELINKLDDYGIGFVYIDNFENGYNFLNQCEDFETFVCNTLKKCDGTDIKRELYEVLNGDNLKRIKNLGLSPKFIQNEVKTHPSDIANNLNPIIITKDEFCVSLERNIGENIQDRLDILNKVGIFVSPGRFCKNLKILHEKISELVEENELGEVFYVIPDIEKSFSIVNYIYQKVNDIDDSHFINCNFKMNKSLIEEISSYPESFTIVVLDDVSATGSSLVTGPFYFTDIPKIREMTGKNINTIIAPMYSTCMAKDFIKSNFDNTKDNSSDNFVTVEMLPEYSKGMSRGAIDNSLMFYAGNGCLTSIVFPYMGPDTNDSRFCRIYEQMLYTPRAQKEL